MNLSVLSTLKIKIMGCSTCTTASTGSPKGCQNNGSCSEDGCNKLTVFDWLSNMTLPAGEELFDCIEVRFKNSRKEFFRNTEKLPLAIGDMVATEAESGHDVGMVTLTGSLVKVQMKKKKAEVSDPNLPKIYRKANTRDLEVWTRCREREAEIQKRSREIAISLNLQMKLSDVEFQGDGSKATFYYTAEERVDFRQLIKDMAKAFGIRIEMRQIGYRQEAQRLGGIGSCGRELCCSTWLTDFRSVGTAAARYQQLSLNPQKLAGQCGKLKCCLNYELDVYVDALKDFPKSDTKIMTEKGIAYCQKVDIFKEKLWFIYKNDPINWHVLTKDQVNEIIELNKKDQKIPSLESYAAENISDETPIYEDAVGQDSLTRFDRPKQRTNKTAKKKINKNTPKRNSNHQSDQKNAVKNSPKSKNNRNRGKNTKGPNRNGNTKTVQKPS